MRRPAVTAQAHGVLAHEGPGPGIQNDSGEEGGDDGDSEEEEDDNDLEDVDEKRPPNAEA